MISKVHIVRRYNMGDYNHVELFCEATNDLGAVQTGTELFIEAGKAIAETAAKFMRPKLAVTDNKTGEKK